MEDSSIRIEVLIVRLPQLEGLRRIPDLRNPARIAPAVSELKSLTSKGTATLIASPIQWCVSGERAVLNTAEEFRYAAEYVPPKIAGSFANVPRRFGEDLLRARATGLSGVPTAFETRDVGVTIAVEPTLLYNRRDIAAKIEARHAELTGMLSGYKPPSLEFAQPRFRVFNITQGVQVVSGEWNLLGVATLAEGESKIDVFVIRITAMP